MKNTNKPWYTNPVKTAKVLERLASKFTCNQNELLRQTLDHALDTLWFKISFYNASNHNSGGLTK